MSKNARADESTLHLATSKGGSLRTTIPAFIVSQFELKQGDKIRWKIDGERIVIETSNDAGKV